MGDDFEVCEYERLSRISLSEPLGGSLEAIEPGDCIVRGPLAAPRCGKR